jgi:SMODS and SLOG-associating 2TM effector domain 1/Protein of unknown function (DUF4231)
MDSVEDAWQRHRRWSKVADETRESLNRWRSRNLALIVLGAVLGALAAQNEWFSSEVTTTFGALGAATLAAAGFIQSRMLGADQVRTWTEARSASESLKAVVYQYLAKVAPFAEPDRDARLADRVDAVQDLAKDYLKLAMTTEPDAKPVPNVSGIADYVTKRAQDQVNWHSKRVREHERLGKRWRNAELIATGSAAVLAAVGGALHGPDLSAWVAVATTVGAAVAAHIASAQHDRIAAGYASTVEELQRLCRELGRGVPTPEAAAGFVVNVERTLATQNQGWASLISQA